MRETRRILLDGNIVDVERHGEEKRSRPPVDRVENERLLVADEIRDQPNDEPDDGHS